MYAVTNEDTEAYLRVTGMPVAISPEFFGDCKSHLQNLVEQGTLTEEILQNWRKVADEMPKPNFEDL